MRIRVLVTVMLASFSSPALAELRCVEPYAPIVGDGATATKDEIQALKLDVIAFIAASDLYQDCLLRSLKDPELKADKREKLAQEVTQKINSNQTEKERVGADYNKAAEAYNARVRAEKAQ